MSSNGKRLDTAASSSGGSSASLETLPDSIIHSILAKLDLDSLCTSACVSRTLHSSASCVLASLSSLDLSAFSPDSRTLRGVFSKLNGLKSVTLDCLCLDYSSVIKILTPDIEELSLLKGTLLSYHLLISIGQLCPNLRVLLLELAWQDWPQALKQNLIELLKGCNYLESLALKIQGTEFLMFDLQSVEFFLPRTLRILKFQPVGEQGTVHFIQKLKHNGNAREPPTNICSSLYPRRPHFILQCLSLVLDVISDELVISIVNALPLLVELDLEDRPYADPMMPHDLSNIGFQSLGSCQHLATLSIVRSRLTASFKHINDMGMFLLSEGCQGLKSVQFGGFSKVTDAGFSAILRSCKNLEKFEVRSASLLSDLTFHDMKRIVHSLIELRIMGCRLITSEAFPQLTASQTLEVLELCGCKDIGDTCLSYISGIQTLTTLNLAGSADVTDEGLAVLSNGNVPITRLCLRGCERITDNGIAHLLRDGGRIQQTLKSLDLGHLPGISDAAISIIASAAHAVTELCLRSCFLVTDLALSTLVSEFRLQQGNRVLRMLDLYHCIKLSNKSLRLFQKQAFHGLRWLGVGLTSLASRRDDFAVISNEQPWLTLCFDGCERGCHDGWHFHKSDS